jgi:hypothetical protein
MNAVADVLILVLCLSIPAAQLQFEGILPPDVNKAALTADYYRIYGLAAPRQRPDPAPVKIIYFTEKPGERDGYGLPEWGGGGAIGRDLIVVPAAFKPFLDQSFSQVTRHEIVHIVLARAYPGIAIPRWFHEGVAMTLSGELSFEENIVVSKAIFTGSLMPLASIDSVNLFGRNKADLAYSQSHLAVLYLIDHYGMEVIADILFKARKMGSFWPGFYSTIALTQKEFEDLARRDVSSRFQLVFVFADYYAFWVAIVFLFLIAFGVTMVRRQKRLAQMEYDEKAEDSEPTTAAADSPQSATTPVTPPPAVYELEARPDGRTDLEMEKYPPEDEFVDDEEYYDDEEYDEYNDPYILADGVEMEDEDDEDFYDEDEESGGEENADDGEEKKD